MSFQPPDLSGRVAIVTGSSRGIGKALALGLARAGADVCVAAKSLEPRETLPGSILQTRDEILALGRRSIAVRTNVRRAEDIEEMVRRTVEELGRVDILVHNAGALWWRPLVETPIQRFDLVTEVNLRAGFHATHCVLPYMIEQGGGHVVLIAPPIDLELLPGKIGYLVGKFGLTMLALGLHGEEGHRGIRSNALWPATMVESQATINHQMGTPEQWRKPEIVADALLAVLAHPEWSGRALTDEEALREAGVTDFEPYNCVPGGKPLYIVGEAARSLVWKERAGQVRASQGSEPGAGGR